MIEGEWDQEWNALLEDDNPNASDKFESPQGRNVFEFLQSCACSFLGVTDAVYKCQFRGFTVHQMYGDSKKFKDWVVKFALALMSRLAKRFPQDDMAIMAAMEIFNPDRCAAKVSSEADLATYGEAELELLIKHYGEAKTVDGKVFEPMIDADEARSEWELLKQTIWGWSKARGNHGGKRALWKGQLVSGELASLPNMYILVCIMLVFAWNTSCCERGFSLMKLIKTCLRNRLYIRDLGRDNVNQALGEKIWCGC
jgi:hypothetical protein